MDLYLNIRKLRKELGLSQEELAKRTGYTDRSSIAKVEQGKVDLSIDKINLFAKALGVTPSELMGDDGIDFSHPELDAHYTDDEVLELVELYTKLNNEQKIAIVNMMKSMINK